MKLYWKAPDVTNSARRIKSYCLLLFFLWNAIPAFAADTPLLERAITIVLKQERTDNALKRISEQGGFIFSYNPAIIDVSKTVSFNFRNKTVREILDEMFDGMIDYRQRKNYVILTKNTSKDSHTVSGYVTDENTGERLKNVTVYDPATLTSAVTDDYGFFKLKVNNPDAIIKVNRVNYADTIVGVPDRMGLLRIQIKNRTDKINILTDSLRKKIARMWRMKILKQQDINLENIHDTLYRKSQVSFFPFIGSNHNLSGNVINDNSYNIFGGYSLGVRKFEIGGLFNTVRGDVAGLQLAGYFNGVYGRRSGLQLAGVANATYGPSSGVQLAGSCNINWSYSSGFAAAGLLNLTHGYSHSTTMAGLANITLGEQKGMHAAGLLNYASRNASVQFSGLSNVVLENVNGAQISGLINFTREQVKGVQLSGLLNYARRIQGAQIGLINISDNIKGVPIGFLSFSLKGYHTIEVFADEIFYTNVAFKTGVRQFYNIFNAGIKPQMADQNFWTVGYGVGTAPKVSKRLALNVDLTANQLSYGNFTRAVNMVNKLYVGLEIQAMPKAAVFFGATLNGYITDTTYKNYTDIVTDYNPAIFYDKTYNNDVNLKMWLGMRAGIRFL